MSKFINMKRLLSFVLALAMVFSIVGPTAVLADSYNASGFAGGGAFAAHGAGWKVDFSGFTGPGGQYKTTDEDNFKWYHEGQWVSIGSDVDVSLVAWSENGNGYVRVFAPEGTGFTGPANGDIFLMSGTFVKNDDANTTITVEPTYIVVDSTGSASYSTTMPSAPTTPEIEAGKLYADEDKKITLTEHNENLFYFTTTANSATSNSDWSVLYTPANADCVKLIRGGETTSVGIKEQGTIIKLSESRYVFKAATWTISGGKLPFQDGDKLVVSGQFLNSANANEILNFQETTITIHVGDSESTVSFGTDSTSSATPFNITALSHREAKLDGDTYQIHFHATSGTLEKWSDFYATETSTVKLIRDGQETVLASAGDNVARMWSSTNPDGFLKIASSKLPDSMLNDGDILVIGGDFKGDVEGDGSNTYAVNIETTYIQISKSGDAYSATYGTTKPAKVIEAGQMKKAERGSLNNGGFYFAMDDNDIPYTANDWNNRFHATSADVMKLTRDGAETSVGKTSGGILVKYDKNGYYMDCNDSWHSNIAGGLKAGDKLVVEGKFTNDDQSVTLNISKTEITVNSDGTLSFSTDPQVLEIGQLYKKEDHGTLNSEGSLYATFKQNTTIATGEYKAESESNVQLSRNGGAYVDIATTTQGGIFNHLGDGVVIIQTNSAWFTNDTGDTLVPAKAGDKLIVQGKFKNGDTEINVTKTEITIGEGGLLSFGTDSTTPAPAPTAVEVGQLYKRDDQSALLSAGHFYFTLKQNTDISEGEYVALSAENVQLTRDGKAYNIAGTNTANGGIFNKAGNDFVLQTNSNWYIIEEYRDKVLPLVAGDKLTVQGQFKNKSDGSLVNVTKTEITIGEGGLLSFSTDPAPVEPIDAGHLKTDSRGYTGKGIYVTMDANDAAYSGWDIEYAPVSKDAVKLIRGETTTEVGIVGRGTLVKFSDTEYYLKTEEWTMGSTMPLQEGDILVVEGKFSHGQDILNISKTYIKIKNGQAILSTEYPQESVEDTTVQAGSMAFHAGGKVDSGIYFTLPKNDLPYDADWKIEYSAVSASCVRLIRANKAARGIPASDIIDVAIPGRGTIVKFSETEYFLKTEAWSLGEYMPLQDGDILVVSGKFAHGEDVMNIDTSYISIQSGLAQITTTYPSADSKIEVIEAGMMAKNPENTSLNTDLDNGSCGLYFTMAENKLPYSDDWGTRYRPVDADSIKLIRDGETLSIGNSAAGTVVKYSSTGYYLALDKWAYPDAFPITTDDILLIEGNFTDGTNLFKISKTYIYFSHGMAMFSAEYPTGENDGVTVINTSTMSADTRGRTDNGIYAIMAANGAPFDTGWSTEYTPVEAGAIKLIRNGVTTNVGIPGRGAIVKFSATEYFLKTEAWSIGNVVPLRDGDILVYEGEFTNSASGAIINIPRTYVGIWYGMPFFSTTQPSGPSLNTVNAGAMLNDTSREKTDAGFYFAMEKNSASYKTDWSLEYAPVDSGAVKLVRDGKTYSVGIPNRGAIVKFSDTEYFFKTEAWSLGDMMPLREGDILIISGSFINSAAGAMINIDESYVFIANGKARAYKAMGEVELANGKDTALTVEGKDITWKVEDKKKLSIDENGKLTALSNRGTVNVFATVDTAGYFWEVKLYEETEYGDVWYSSVDEEMTIGVWCGSYHEFDEAHMTQLEEAGINLLIGVNEQWVGDKGMKSLLSRARSHGIKIIADLRDWDGETVPEWADHDMIEGFLMFDEPCATDFEKLAELKTKFDELMPEGKTFYVNLFPQACSYESLYGDDYDKNAVDYEENYVKSFVDTVDPEQLSVDIYPLLDWKERSEESIVIRPSYFSNLDILSKYALDNELPLELTILSAGHNTTDGAYPTPDDAQMRWQMAVGMAYGASRLNHYVYTSHEDDYTCMVDYDGPETTDLFEAVKTVTGETGSWSDIYLSYDYLGTSKVDAGDKNLMLEELTYDVAVDEYGCLSQVTSDQDLLIGSFVNDNEEYGYMITNAGDAQATTGVDYLADFTMEDAKVTVQLKSGSYKCVAVIRNGEFSYVAVDADGSFTIDVAANEGVFVIPVSK